MKKHISTIIVVVIFICGLSLFLYPMISNLYNEYLNKKLIGDYKEAMSQIKPEASEKAMEQALLYNQNLGSEQKLKELGLTYEDTLNVLNNGIMGYIEIPKINVSLVIYHSIKEDVLQNGIGHVPESHLPVGGENTHCVLAEHTGLPYAKLLTNIDHLDMGDSFFIHVLDEVLEYRIDSITVVEPHEVEHIGVVSGSDCVTLVTCTPYGVNSHRLLVRGKRIAEGDMTYDGIGVANEVDGIDLKYLVVISLIGIVVVVFAVVKIRKLIKKKMKRKVVKRPPDE